MLRDWSHFCAAPMLRYLCSLKEKIRIVVDIIYISYNLGTDWYQNVTVEVLNTLPKVPRT